MVFIFLFFFFSFCLSTSVCSFHHCYLCLPRLHENHLWNSHCLVNIAWHATPLTTRRTKRSKLWIFLFILFPIYLFPTSSLIKKKKRTGVKTEQLKYLSDLTRTRVTKISRISWVRHFPVNWFFNRKGQSFCLHGQDKDTDSFTWPPV